MKRLPLILFVLFAVAQTFAQKAEMLQEPNAPPMPKGPSASQLYCGGFITHTDMPRDHYIIGGAESPHVTRYGRNDTVYLSGTGYQVGQRYIVVREVHDPNKEEMWPNQGKRVAALGHLYQELGFLEITHLAEQSTVGSFTFPCDTAVPGDFLIPFEAREILYFRTDDTGFREFGYKTRGPRGKIILGKEFDSMMGRGSIAYIDLGSKQGLKPGDYLIVTRTYSPGEMVPMDSVSLEAKTDEDTQRNARKISTGNLEKMPRRGIGEVMVTNVMPDTATVIVIKSLTEVQLGDSVQIEEPQ